MSAACRIALAAALAAGLAGCIKTASPTGGGRAVPAADPTADPSMAGLKALDARLEALEREMADLFNGVTDEASASAAAGKVTALTPAYAELGRTRLRLIAVLDCNSSAAISVIARLSQS